MASQDNSRRRWSDAENALFLQGLEALGRTQWRRIASEFVKTRSAHQVRSKVQKHFKTPPRPREEEAVPRRSLGDLPDVLLAGALDYSDLGEVAACAAASLQLRDGLRRVAPALQRRFVFRRFPILSTIDASAEEPPPPRELFLSQTRLFAAGRPALPPLSRAFDEYVFSIELELVSHSSDQGVVTTSRESVFVGKGEAIDGDQHAQVSFEIPEDVFNRAWNSKNNREGICLCVMASKGFSRARLGHGTADDYDEYTNIDNGRCLMFYNLCLAESRGWRHGEMEGLDWLQDRQLDADFYYIPTVDSYWDMVDNEVVGNMSKLILDFQWANSHDDREMTREDAARALEHYAKWT